MVAPSSQPCLDPSPKFSSSSSTHHPPSSPSWFPVGVVWPPKLPSGLQGSQLAPKVALGVAGLPVGPQYLSGPCRRAGRAPRRPCRDRSPCSSGRSAAPRCWWTLQGSITAQGYKPPRRLPNRPGNCTRTNYRTGRGWQGQAWALGTFPSASSLLDQPRGTLVTIPPGVWGTNPRWPCGTNPSQTLQPDPGPGRGTGCCSITTRPIPEQGGSWWPHWGHVRVPPGHVLLSKMGSESTGLRCRVWPEPSL